MHSNVNSYLKSYDPLTQKISYSITNNSENKVIGIVWITSYMCDNFKRYENYLLIDVMISYVCNLKEFRYIAPVVLNKI